MATLELSPGERFGLTDSMAHNHTDRCPVCSSPSLDRKWAGCRSGRLLEQQWLRHWRARLDALSDRRRI